MSAENDKAITLSYENGRRVVLRLSEIVAVDGNETITTIYLRGHAIQIPQPVNTILPWLYKQKQGSVESCHV